MSFGANTQLRIVTLGESPKLERKKNETPKRHHSAKEPRTTIKTNSFDTNKIRDAMPRPVSSAINRFKANNLAREKNELKFGDIKRRSSSPLVKTPYSTTTDSPNQNDSPKAVLTEIHSPFQFLPDPPAISKPPTTVNHNPLPVGAHTSGFYSKIRNEPYKTLSKPIPTISDMMSELKIKPIVPDSITTNSVSRESRSRKDVVPKYHPIVVRNINEWFEEPETDLIETNLASLTDADSPTNRTVDALGILIKQSELSTELAMESFKQLNGFSILLKASEITAKGYLSSKLQSVSPQTRKPSSLISQNRNDNKEGRVSITIENMENSSMEMPIITIDSDTENVRTISMQPKSIITSILAKYFEPSFMEQFEAMTTEKRAQHVNNLLRLFQRLDRLTTFTTTLCADINVHLSIDKLVHESANVMHVQHIIIYKIDETTGEIYHFEPNEHESNVINKFLPGHGIVGYSAEIGEMINVRKPALYPHFSADIDSPNQDQPYSILSIPIPNGQKTIGILLAINKQGPAPTFEDQYFDAEDEYCFKHLSYIAGTIMGNANIYDHMNTVQKKVAVLLETTRSLASILDLDKLIKVIMDSAKELLSSDRCTLFLHDPERKQLRFIVQGRDSVQELRIPSNAGIAGAVFTSGVEINIQDAYKDSRFNPEVDKTTGYVTRTILCMPIKNIHGECIGVTQMINKRNGVYSSEDEMILSSFSSQAAVAIEKSQLFKKTEDMRIYLQSILSSITSCVVALSESMKLNTINRPWFVNALGVEESFMKEYSVEKWIGELNQDLLKDIRQVYQDRQSIYVTDYEIRGSGSNVIVNYQIMPLIGSHGVVIVLDDISSEKRAVMTLGRYMSPALAKQVMEDGSGQLGGKRKKVSILFSDIRSFTTLSEGMDPPEVVELLNHHFTDAVNAITEEQGILDKFIGDAVMAVFGVPFSNPDDAIHACNTALKMRDALLVTNIDRQSQGKKKLSMGIGVNTGVVLSGNIGSTKRMEFSCIGDAVNLASRTEGMTKFYGITILVTEYTLQETGDSYLTREVESVIVTGKKQSVKMFELLGKKGDILEIALKEAIKYYNAGYDFYKRRMFSDAIEMFEGAISANDDGPSKVLLTRCRNYLENPPAETWEPVYVAEGK